MKIAIISIIVVLLMGGVGEGATTCYVSPGGSNTSPYDTWAKAANLPSTAVTYLNGRSSSGHTLLIGPGSYSESDTAFTLTDGDTTNIMIRGVSAAGVTAACNASNCLTYPATRNEVSITAVNDGVYVFGINGCDVRYLTFAGGIGAARAVLNITNSTGFIADYIWATDIAGMFISIGGSTTYAISHGMWRGTTKDPAMQLTGTAAGNLNYTIATSGDSNDIPTRMFVANSSGINNINNCVFLGGTTKGIDEVNASGTTNVNNTTIGTWGGTVAPIQRSAGTIVATSCRIIPSYYTGATLGAGVTDGGGNIVTGNTGLTSWPRAAYISLNVDDPNNASYVTRVGAVFAAKGVKGTWFYNPVLYSDYTADTLTAIATGGFDVAFHGRTHSNMAATGTVWTVSKGAETITLSRSGAGSITYSGGGGVSNILSRTLASIRAELVSDGVTVTNSDQYTAGEVNANLLGQSLAESADGNIQLLLDATAATGFYKDEIVDGYAEMGTLFTTWDNRSFATPYGTTAANVKTVAKSIGLWEVRRNTAAGADNALRAFDLYDAAYIPIKYFITSNATADEATTKNNTRALCEWMLQQGCWMHLLAHNDAGAQVEATPEQWGWIIDTIKEYPQITIGSDAEILAIIRSSGTWNDSGTGADATADDGVWSRTWNDASNYALLSTSDLINAGTNTPLASHGSELTDYAGNPVADDTAVYSRWIGGVQKDNVDIGAYNYVSDPLAISFNGTTSLYTVTGGYFNTSSPYVWTAPSGTTKSESGDQKQNCDLTLNKRIPNNQSITVTDGVGTAKSQTLPMTYGGGNRVMIW